MILHIQRLDLIQIYMERIINAIDNCKNFENDISKLKENVGTNIYYLFGKFM